MSNNWSRWLMFWKTPVALFAWLTGTIRSLCGRQTGETPIENDIEGGQQKLYREDSCGTSFRAGIRRRIDDLQTPICATCVTKPAEPFSGGDTGFRTILGNGTSSTVYLIHGNKAEKRFESSEDLLNERAIYRVLGSHPRLLSIYNIGPDYMVMEWMKNGDLAHFLRAHPEILPKYKHRWIMQIAESFGLLHTYQISHCDSKLENFLLDANYNIKICDFASSHNYRAPSKDLAIQPMRYRRAVDDFDEAVFNPADDIFAFGSICYEIITGGPPYPQLDDENVRLHFSQSDFPPTDGLSYGSIISDCWNGNCISFKAILSAIEQEIGQFEVCKIDDSNSDST